MLWLWVLTLSLASVLALAFLIGFALSYLMLDAGVLGRFEGCPEWIITHVLGGFSALLLGPIQLWLRATRRRLALHRKLGVLCRVRVLVGSLVAFYLAVTTQGTWVFGGGVGFFEVAWLLTTGVAYAAIRRCLILQHQEWLICS